MRDGVTLLRRLSLAGCRPKISQFVNFPPNTSRDTAPNPSANIPLTHETMFVGNDIKRPTHSFTFTTVSPHCKKSHHETTVKRGSIEVSAVLHRCEMCIFITIGIQINISMYSLYYFLDRVLFHYDFHHDSCDYQWDFYSHSFHFEPHV